ncbi:26S proteasome non-ATPase regulatory subunit 8-like [Centruroides sculpturatus]|uniref:26S proteasome non-ATPase regulatory subunit 8-like n=2 Tax=Centruroides sculpturatus TaxID=218467 RepID=UPI000C6D7904|nr:26S proteasome non-ATPase regulatory subunit 8-like [Centruroides sculpturatus]
MDKLKSVNQFKMGTSGRSFLKETIVPTYQKLFAEWNKTPPNLAVCQRLLNAIEVELTNISFLPTSQTSIDKQELLITRDTLEIGARLSIATADIPSFERYMAQLKCYYFDYQNDVPDSNYKYHLLGLNLLRLLAQNRMAEFHMELELLPFRELQNIYIRHPVSLEQYLMEGSYNKIFLSRGNVPANDYKFFMDILLNTVRNEIASCIEKAYEQLAFTEARRMLFFETQDKMEEYARERGWKMDRDNRFVFIMEVKQSDTNIPASELASQTIQYARELEKIV